MLQKLKDRQQELFVQKQATEGKLNQALADLNAINGAMQENLMWIKRLEVDDADASTDKTDRDH